jgi:hypothetical protein
VGERHHNAHSAAGALRGWFTAPGAQDAVDVVLLDSMVPVSLGDAAREMIGNTPAVRYDGMLRSRHPFSVWVSDDASRVPIRLRTSSKVGTIEVDMVDYTVPRVD